MKKQSSITSSELARNMADVLNRVSYRGECFQIFRGGKPIAALEPLHSGAGIHELKALLANLPSLSEGEASSFLSDLHCAEEQLGKLKDPWE